MAQRVRVHEIAKRVGLSNKRVVKLLQQLGYKASSHSSSLSNGDAARAETQIRDMLLTGTTASSARSGNHTSERAQSNHICDMDSSFESMKREVLRRVFEAGQRSLKRTKPEPSERSQPSGSAADASRRSEAAKSCSATITSPP
jgi:hypothetical protein